MSKHLFKHCIICDSYQDHNADLKYITDNDSNISTDIDYQEGICVICIDTLLLMSSCRL